MADPGSLANLNDIIEAPPVPWWPPAPGWLFLLGIAVLLLLFLLTRAVLRYRRNAYRRAALAELGRAASVPQPLPLIAALLKRTALAAYPRKTVAGLTGQAWIEWLAATSGLSVPPAVATAFQQTLYHDRHDGAADPKAVSDFAAKWIRRHRGGP
jgi:hypothetical protein